MLKLKGRLEKKVDTDFSNYPTVKSLNRLQQLCL